MRVIYKYQIPIKESFTISMPKNAKIIRIDDVDGLCFMWAEVDTNNPNENRDFRAYKTGQEFKNEEGISLSYLGFCKIFIAQELCLYIYEVIPKLDSMPAGLLWSCESPKKIGFTHVY
jgi:hypothetical protein